MRSCILGIPNTKVCKGGGYDNPPLAAMQMLPPRRFVLPPPSVLDPGKLRELLERIEHAEGH